MLYGIPAGLPAKLLSVLASMGHGDEIALVDANYPAASHARETVTGELIELCGRNLTEATRDILSLMPLDSFDETPALVMGSPGEHVPSVHAEITELLGELRGGPWPLTPLERFPFYERARKTYAMVRTLERRPYGNLVLKKGVLTPDGDLMSPETASAVE